MSTNDEENDKSRAWTWLFAVVALPLVYLLSVPPVALMAWKVRGMHSMPPPWLETYAKPYVWLAEETPLKAPLLNYARLWEKVLF